MTYVRLGTHNQDVVEFFIFNDKNEQIGSIYYTVGNNCIMQNVIGKLPENLEYQLYKTKDIASNILLKRR